MDYDVIIVGSGHAGANAALTLRQAGFEGSLAIIGDERELPYERPPLSKEYFAGEKPFERILIRPAKFWEDRQVELVQGRHIVAVDPHNHRISTAEGEHFHYGKLIWAAGGRPRPLPVPGGDLPGVQGVRSRADADQMKTASQTAGQIVVIGGGYIGLEAAAVLAKAGKKVVVLEALDRVLARVAGADLSRFFEHEHRAHGVDIRLGVAVEALEGRDRVEGVRLASGEVIPADLVIVGIGIIPAVEPLLAAGAQGDNGVCVDEYGRTSLPDIYAVGDCAAHANRYVDGAVIRLESVQNAHDQAAVAARHICGVSEPYEALPWFWSNQYDLKLQTVGLSIGHDATILRGKPENRSFSVVYLRGGKVVALDCVNAMKDYVQGRLLVQHGAVIAPADLADASRPLKDLPTAG